MINQSNKVLFYEEPWNCFLNSSSFMVLCRGFDWMTSEHAYQAARFMHRPALMEAIWLARSAHDAKKVARANSEFKVPNWPLVKLGIMEEIVRAKLGQHPYIQRKLLETGYAIMIKNSPKNDFWGIGPDGNGQNHMGRIWMKLRAELRAGK